MKRPLTKAALVLAVALMTYGGDCEDLEEIDLDFPIFVVDDDDDDVIVVPDPPVSIYFENVSSFDIELGVVYDDVADTVFVPFDGPPIIIDLEWCPDQVLIDYEDHFDPFTGDFIEGFDWATTGDLDSFYGYDYICGDTLIYSFSDFDVEIDAVAGLLKAQDKPDTAKARSNRTVSRPAPVMEKGSDRRAARTEIAPALAN